MDGLSEYEMERRRKMERNHLRLQELGLVGRGKAWEGPMATTGARPRGSNPKPKPRKRAAATPAPAVVAVRKSSRTSRKPAPVYTYVAASASASASARVGVRKSSRTSGKRAPVYTDAIDSDSDFDEGDELGNGSGHSSAEEEHRQPQGWLARKPWSIAPPAVSARRAATPAAPDSSRNLECDIPMLMERYLGRRFPSFGKAPVMELATKSCTPKFSKMSGVTEWKNAVFLWVNVDGGSGYENLFERSRDVSRAAGSGNDDEDDVKAVDGSAAAAAAAAREASNGSTRSEKPEGGGIGNARRPRHRGGASAATPPRAERASSKGDGGRNGAEERGAAKRVSEFADRDAGRLTGLKMTWFAGGRMTAESALIQRLLRNQGSQEAGGVAAAGGAGVGPMPPPKEEGNEVENVVEKDSASAKKESGSPSGDDEHDAVLLFCRLPSAPYVFCGRLGYSKHWSAERPVRFVWRLLDAARLAQWPDFGDIVELAGVE